MRRAGGSLADYRSKRDFDKTPEPAPKAARRRGNGYLIQKHDATRLHYDLRLELDGVLKSWAVTKGPSLNPADRRLAVRTEDHPLDYGTFEGTIPQGQYGGGTVMLWDRGTWAPVGDPHEGLTSGNLKFDIAGERLTGRWVLVRMKPRARETRENWLLIKDRDASADRTRDVLAENTISVVTGRAMEEIAAGTGARKRGARRVQAPLPAFVEPQLATLVDKPPHGADWLSEVKFDGYRVLIAASGGETRFYTRSGLDWSERFAALAGPVRALGLEGALIDGEMVAIQPDGRSDFGALHEALRGEGRAPLSYFAFDCLMLDGEDLRRLPLATRKARLEKALGKHGATGPVFYTDHIKGGAEAMHGEMCRLGLEGIVAKRADAPYRSGRGTSWVKVKCTRAREFVIGGFVASDKKDRPFASLLVGEWEGDKLVFRGGVGSGFTQKTLAGLAARFAKLGRKTSPFAEVPREVRRRAHWLEPELVAHVEYAEITRDGSVRHGRFVALREDKPAREVAVERPLPIEKAIAMKNRKPAAAADDGGGDVQVAGVRLSHPERILYPRQGVTKRDLALYLERAAPLMLPHLAKRPTSLVRCPEGRQKSCFFQRHVGAGLPKAFRTVAVTEKDGDHAEYVYLEDVAGLVSAAQVGVLELHIWGSRVDDVMAPDRIVFDLDPDEAVPFTKVREAAVHLRDALAALSLTSFAMVTGGKGVHVVVPVQRRHDWPLVKAFSAALARAFEEDAPDQFVATMTKAKRKGRIFIDHFRNERSSTAIAPYSPRAREGAAVACPVSWDELAQLPRADTFTLPAMAERLAAPDPWAGYFEIKQSLRKSALEALGL